MQILIIDDNTEITDMLSFYLENDGYECKVVNDGKEGLQAIKSENFDLALLDLAMPEISGMDIINSLKKDNLLEKKKIVVLIAKSSASVSWKFIDLLYPFIRQVSYGEYH